ncbi:MAG: DegV family protein [Lachnospiraceae bacterium]|nr:DegV family protein [Lachnospiraceae bacterium]
MSDYLIVTDATADLPVEITSKLGIKVVPMSFMLGDREYLFHPGSTGISLDEFYEAIDGGTPVSTSQIGPSAYVEFLEPFLKENKDIIYICFSSGLSGCYGASVVAVDSLREKYPERRITTIDSLCASIGEGMLVYLAALRLVEGMSYDEMLTYIENTRHKICHWFLVKDLNQLKKGGRISPLEAALGTTLGIVPIISTDCEGKLTVISKIHGLKKAIRYLIDRLRTDSFDKPAKQAFIGHGHCPEYAKMLEETILAEGLASETRVLQIGPVIGSHVGSGMCAVVFEGEQD